MLNTIARWLGFLKPEIKKVEREMSNVGVIKATNTGFGLFRRTGELVGTYSRRRDAVRGARRRGLVVA